MSTLAVLIMASAIAIAKTARGHVPQRVQDARGGGRRADVEPVLELVNDFHKNGKRTDPW